MHISLEIALNKNHYIHLSFLITICLLGTRNTLYVYHAINMVWLCVHCKEPIPKIGNKYSQKKNCAATVSISTFMCLWAIYVQDRSAYSIPLHEICGPILEYINRSQTHQCGNLDWGRAILIKGIHKCDFLCSVLVCLALMYFRDLITAWRTLFIEKDHGSCKKYRTPAEINFPLLGKCKPQCK